MRRPPRKTAARPGPRRAVGDTAEDGCRWLDVSHLPEADRSALHGLVGSLRRDSSARAMIADLLAMIHDADRRHDGTRTTGRARHAFGL